MMDTKKNSRLQNTRLAAGLSQSQLAAKTRKKTFQTNPEKVHGTVFNFRAVFQVNNKKFYA